MFKEIIGGFRREDKGKKLTTKYEDATEASDFAGYIGDVDFGVEEDLQDNFENRNLMLEEKYSRLDPRLGAKLVTMGINQEKLATFSKEKTEGVIEIAIAELKKDEIQKEAREQKEIDEAGTYSLPDFQLMEKAAKFKALFDKNPKLKKNQPVFADGKPMTIEQIEEQSVKYWKYSEEKYVYEADKKNHKDPSAQYNKAELDLIKKCSEWFFLYRQIDGVKDKPTFADNSPMTDKQVNELSEEYGNFRKENPAEFAELKFKNKEWMKEDIKWQLSEYNGRPIWKALNKSISMTFKDGTKHEVKTEYVARNVPKGFNLADLKTSYFIVGNTVKGEEPGNLVILLNLKKSWNKEETVAK